MNALEQILRKPLFAVILAVIGLLGSVASLWSLPGLPGQILGGLLVAVVLFVGGIALGGRVTDARVRALQVLGITHVFPKCFADPSILRMRLLQSKRVRILAVRAEGFLGHHGETIKEAVRSGVSIEWLLATPDSQFVKEIDDLQSVARGGSQQSVQVDCQRAEEKLRGLLAEAHRHTPETKRHTLGSMRLGKYNTQYRESMIICDDNWVWWTPHMTPAGSDERPTFVAEGAESRFVRQCDQHFESIKGRCTVSDLAPT